MEKTTFPVSPAPPLMASLLILFLLIVKPGAFIQLLGMSCGGDAGLIKSGGARGKLSDRGVVLIRRLLSMLFVITVGESMFSSSEMGEGRARRRKKASDESCVEVRILG